MSTLVEAILNYPQEEVPDLIRQIRTCESLDLVADAINARDHEIEDSFAHPPGTEPAERTSPFESHLSNKLGQLRIDDSGGTRYYGGTSNLLLVEEDLDTSPTSVRSPEPIEDEEQGGNPITSWTTVTQDAPLIAHLLNMYFTWHYSFFVTLSQRVFRKHFLLGNMSQTHSHVRKHEYCSPVLVNAMLALGCHFSSRSGAREDPEDPATAGDHFFEEARRLLLDKGEYESPRLSTIQAAALMSVREAGCGREARGWTYSVRMGQKVPFEALDCHYSDVS